MDYKITNAEVKGEEIVVTASFLKDGKKVKEIIHAFPNTMDSDEIRSEVVKAMDLYVAELEQQKEQKVVDEAAEKDNKLITSLIDK